MRNIGIVVLALALGTTASVAFASVFYLIVERHFIGTPRLPVASRTRPDARAQAEIARK